MTADERKEAIDGLRQMVKFLDENPQAPIPHEFRGKIDVFLRDEPGSSIREQLAKIAAIPGGWEKNHVGDYFELKRSFGSLTLIFNVTREQVCKRVVTGKKTVTEMVPDPDAPRVHVTKEVEIFEWDCSGSIFEDTNGGKNEQD